MPKLSLSNFIPDWKSVVYIFVPGWVGFIPCFILMHYFKTTLGIVNLFEKYEYLFLLYLINSIIVGLLLNEFGSWIESWFDKIIECEDKTHSKNWYKYLLLNSPTKKSKIIFKVITDVVIRLKFGINFSISLLLLIITFPLLQFENIINWQNPWLLLFEIVVLLIAIVQLRTAFFMSKGLSEYRKFLLDDNG